VRNRIAYLLPVLHYLGGLFWIFSGVLVVPVLILVVYARAGYEEVSPLCYLAPAVASFALGLALKRGWSFGPLDVRRSMLVCALGWISISAVGAMPLWLGLRCSYLDAYFEAVSGFTTTGITMFQGLDHMPRSILVWRAFMQWLGGLGILAFFLVAAFSGGAAHHLFSAESHKIFSKRPAPGLFRTVRILWLIYTLFTGLIVGLLVAEGVSLYDAVAHSFTALSTGGYSPYDASIDYYRQTGYTHFAAIEYTLTLGMLLGGMNFFIHYRVLTKQFKALWDNLEMRLFWLILGGAFLLVGLDHSLRHGFGHADETIRYSLFQVVAIMTTTGFATKDIGSSYFPALAKQIFLVLMVVGGCVGSTGGGIKVLRIGVLLGMVSRQVRRVLYGESSVYPVTVDREIIETGEVRRIASLFFAWMLLLLIGGGVTALLSEWGPLESASGMFSALGNIGPCYIPADQIPHLHPLIKVAYILGMLAGRLEILPILLLFTRRTWR
jgi:trk system potassium uptake protein TrkH